MWYNLNFIQWTEVQTFKRSALPETWELLKKKGTMVGEQELRKDIISVNGILKLK